MLSPFSQRSPAPAAETMPSHVGLARKLLVEVWRAETVEGSFALCATAVRPDAKVTHIGKEEA